MARNICFRRKNGREFLKIVEFINLRGRGCIHQISVLRDLPLMLSLRILLCKRQLRISGCRNQSAFGKKTCLLCDCWNVVNVFRTVDRMDIDFWSMSSRLQMDIENPSIGVSKFRGHRFRRRWVWNLFFWIWKKLGSMHTRSSTF